MPEKYIPVGSDFVPVEKWGKDHNSVIIYLECRAVDHKGVIDNRQMRCNPRLHREFVGFTLGHIQDASKYPTRLADGQSLENHDDWSCLEDFVAAEMINAFFERTDFSSEFGCNTATIEFTQKGFDYVAKLRQQRANKGVKENA